MIRPTSFFRSFVLGWISVVVAWGQCSDWSPFFNQIDDPTIVQQLQSMRAQGWPQFNPANEAGASLQQLIAQGGQLIAQKRQDMLQVYQTWAATRAYNTSTISISYAECRGAMNANMAAACQYHNDQNELLELQGLNDLMRCRAGMPQGSYGAIPSGGINTDSNGNYGAFSPGDRAAYQQGANSVNGINESKREAMVSSALKDWQPPADQEAPTNTLAQTTSLTDPFAEGINSPAPTSPGADTSGVDAGSSGDQWTDPLATDSGGPQGQGDAASSDSDPPPSQEEVAQALDEGTADAASTEVSATTVAQVNQASHWDDFADSGTNSEVTNSITVDANQASDPTAQDTSANLDAGDDELDAAHEAIDASIEALKSMDVVDTNPISDDVLSQGTDAIFGYGHQLLKTESDVFQEGNGLFGGSTGGVSDSQVTSDLQNIPSAILPLGSDVKSLEPDYNTMQQAASNASSWVQAKEQYFYNIVTGRSQCNEPQFGGPDPECEH